MALWPAKRSSAPRQVSLLFRCDSASLAAQLPVGARPLGPCGAQDDGLALVELVCADLRLVGEVAVLVWRVSLEPRAGEPGPGVAERWARPRLGSARADHWVLQRMIGERGQRHAHWVEDRGGGLRLDVRAGDRHLSFRGAPVGQAPRSAFLTTRAAERYLIRRDTLLGPHPWVRWLDRSSAAEQHLGLQPLAVFDLDCSAPAGLEALEFDSAYLWIQRRRQGHEARSNTGLRSPRRRGLPDPALSVAGEAGPSGVCEAR
jgi:hypothetical protein